MYGRPHKRLHQACENCRKKKTRCPGERPVCSSCSRLLKTCKYPELRQVTDSRAESGSTETERRLSQLEAKIRMMERQDPLPPENVLKDVVESYFQYCHMQPLWLFDRQDLSSISDCREDTILSLLALASCHSKHSFFQGRLDELVQVYGQAAREKIMQRVGSGKVSLSTIQSLCILALANLQSNNSTLVYLHVGMATTLANCANLNFETCAITDLSLRAESRRRVFWSLNLLQQMYGHQVSPTNILQDISRPRYVATNTDLRKTLDELPPALPCEDIPNSDKKSGTWAYMIQLSTLWGEVRTYIKQWTQRTSDAPAPWSIESGYTVISARLMDSETKFPAPHRFESGRFTEQDSQHLESNREYWTPWLYQQFTYHTIHNMLNHPFLYSSRPQQSAQLGVPNTFWKTSSELAFIHSIWVSRLIDMVTQKSYRISDPFIGHCAAIAATIHIYFCRAADKKTAEAALDRLAKCVAFMAELALIWPSCTWLHERLQALIRSAFAVDHGREKEQTPRTISINTRVMWDILLYNLAAYRRTASACQTGSLFDGSSLFLEDDADEGEDIVEMDDFHSPMVEVTLSNGQALPPRSGRRMNGDKQNSQSSKTHVSTLGSSRPSGDAQSIEQMPLTPWPVSLDMAYDSFFQFQDPGSSVFGTWEVGNL